MAPFAPAANKLTARAMAEPQTLYAAFAAKLDAARSLMPASLEIPADRRASCIAALRNEFRTPLFSPSAIWASASERASRILFRARRSLVCASDTSIIFAKKMVQVTSEAKARPIITILTRISADKNIDHGDNSCGVGAVLSGVAAAPGAGAALDGISAGDAATDDGATDGDAAAGIAEDDAAGGDAAGAWTWDPAGAVIAGVAGCGAALFCCAIAGATSDATVSVAANESFIRVVLNIGAFIPRPSSE